MAKTDEKARGQPDTAAAADSPPPAAQAEPKRKGKARAKRKRARAIAPFWHGGINYLPARTLRTRAGRKKDVPADEGEFDAGTLQTLVKRGLVEEVS